MKAGYLYAHHLLMEWANIPRDVGTGIYGDGYHYLIIKMQILYRDLEEKVYRDRGIGICNTHYFFINFLLSY